jgi:hypothetical protein
MRLKASSSAKNQISGRAKASNMYMSPPVIPDRASIPNMVPKNKPKKINARLANPR